MPRPGSIPGRLAASASGRRSASAPRSPAPAEPSASSPATARAFGMYAERVTRADDLAAAIDRALANRPALLDVVVSPAAVSSDARSGLARVPDLQALDAWDDAERLQVGNAQI